MYLEYQKTYCNQLEYKISDKRLITELRTANTIICIWELLTPKKDK